MSKYDEESVLPTVEELPVTPENEEEIVRSIRREEAAALRYTEIAEAEAKMSEWELRRSRCTHDYDCCGCFPED